MLRRAFLATVLAPVLFLAILIHIIGERKKKNSGLDRTSMQVPRRRV